MADRMLDLMLKLDAVRGISGYEEAVAELMHAELAPYPTSIRRTRSAITTSRGAARRTRRC